MLFIAAAIAGTCGQASPVEPGWVQVEGASFEMGLPEDAPWWAPVIQAPHRVEVEGFHLMRTEVTAKAYDACVARGKCTPAARGDACNSGVEGREDHPANCVTWTQADAYCRAHGSRLPTEPEWELAARGPESRTHPWGNEKGFVPEADVFPPKVEGAETFPVGTCPAGATPEGIQDLSNNVWEWTASGTGATRVTKGGGFLPSSGANRFPRGVEEKWDYVGFRCAAEVPPEPVPTEEITTLGATDLVLTEKITTIGMSGTGTTVPRAEPVVVDPADQARCPSGFGWVPGGTARVVGSDVAVEGFCLARTEATVGDLRACERCEGLPQPDASYLGCTVSKNDRRLPANCLPPVTAEALCASQGRRLPTEAEWVLAAAGPTPGRTYAWGEEEPDATRLQSSPGDSFDGYARVGTHPAGATELGLQDMAGNAAEWTSTRVGEGQVLRGGGFLAFRSGYDPTTAHREVVERGLPVYRYPTAGVRCAFTP